MPHPQEFTGLLARLQSATAQAAAVVTQHADRFSPLDAWFTATRLHDIACALDSLTARMTGEDKGPDSRRVAELFDLPTSDGMTEAQGTPVCRREGYKRREKIAEATDNR